MRLVLLPGMDGTGRLFKPLVEALPASLSATIIAYPPDQPLGYSELLPLVEAAVAEESKFVLVGESFSGPLAIMLAARRPLGLQGLVLCASFVQFPFRQLPTQWRTMIRSWMFHFQPRWLIAWALLGRHSYGRVGRLLRETLALVSPTALAARAQSVATLDVTGALRDCPVPVLYLRPSEDWLIPRDCVAQIQSVQPHTEVVEIPGPHLVLQACPRPAAQILESFCQHRTASIPTNGGRRFHP